MCSLGEDVQTAIYNYTDYIEFLLNL